MDKIPKLFRNRPQGKVLTAIRTKMLGLTAREIAAATGLAPREVRYALDDLLYQRQIIPVSSPRSSTRYMSKAPTHDEARAMRKIIGGKKGREMWRALAGHLGYKLEKGRVVRSRPAA